MAVTRTSAEKRREYHLKSAYGLSLEEWDRIWVYQGKQCPVCKRAPKEGRRPVVDHDHKTGEIRGLLCSHCNQRVIGRGRDAGIFAAAAAYLECPPARSALGERRAPKRRRSARKKSSHEA